MLHYSFFVYTVDVAAAFFVRLNSDNWAFFEPMF